jgi:hypothetical protein
MPSRLKGTVILEVSHGYHVKDQNDPLVELADKCMEEFSLATSMGFLVDLFPICRSSYLSRATDFPPHPSLVKYVPAWFPFANFKRTAAKWRQNFVDTVEEPFAFVKREMVSERQIVSPSLGIPFTSDNDFIGQRHRSSLFYIPVTRRRELRR